MEQLLKTCAVVNLNSLIIKYYKIIGFEMDYLLALERCPILVTLLLHKYSEFT